MMHKTKRKTIRHTLLIIGAATGLCSTASCVEQPKNEKERTAQKATVSQAAASPVSFTQMNRAGVHDFTYTVDPATFDIRVTANGKTEQVSIPLSRRKYDHFTEQGQRTQWTYPQDHVKVVVEKQADYLQVTIHSLKVQENEFTWPVLDGDSYMLPFGEGKLIPNNDPHWKRSLSDDAYSWIESCSMNMMVVNKRHHSLLYIVENPFDNEVLFQKKPTISMNFTHEFPSIEQTKQYSFRIYVTNPNPVAAVKRYKAYLKEKKQVKTLLEKEKENPNIRKLYGAPHLYMWGVADLLTNDNIHWDKMKQQIDAPIWSWIQKLHKKGEGEESAKELQQLLQEAKTKGWNRYSKRVVVRMLNGILQSPQFYHENQFPSIDATLRKRLASGTGKLSEQQLYECNKQLLKSALQDAVDDISKWGQHTVRLLQKMKQAGVQTAWIGLSEWGDGLMNPMFVQTASELGYLIGPYDSYHSIHKNDPAGQQKSWTTAQFPDPSLYDNATITNKRGKKISGFLNKGRKLNPTLSLPSVKQRVEAILQDHILYNSWFIDCDATGEIYNDYSPEHITTQQQDKDARLARMAYIGTNKNMVIGSEGGHDFASKVIAFAHGIETPVIGWGDPDMGNKNSPYYIGAYYAHDSAIPDLFRKQVPLKLQYDPIIFGPEYAIPAYKLAHNEEVITTHQWGNDSLKFKGKVVDRTLFEFLYNVPPMYHVDGARWETIAPQLAPALKVWSAFHEKAVTREMTSWGILSSDRLLQYTEFGSDLKVIVNFSKQDKKHESALFKKKSVTIYVGNNKIEFQPKEIAS